MARCRSIMTYLESMEVFRGHKVEIDQRIEIFIEEFDRKNSSNWLLMFDVVTTTLFCHKQSTGCEQSRIWEKSKSVCWPIFCMTTISIDPIMNRMWQLTIYTLHFGTALSISTYCRRLPTPPISNPFITYYLVGVE